MYINIYTDVKKSILMCTQLFVESNNWLTCYTLLYCQSLWFLDCLPWNYLQCFEVLLDTSSTSLWVDSVYCTVTLRPAMSTRFTLPHPSSATLFSAYLFVKTFYRRLKADLKTAVCHLVSKRLNMTHWKDLDFLSNYRHLCLLKSLT